MIRHLAVLSVAALLATGASATTIRGFTTRGMVQEAAAVVRGTVTSGAGVYNADRTRIYTDWVVTVREVLVGRVQSRTLTLRQIGGTVGEATMHVEGTAPLSVGEEVLLFLRTDGTRWYTVGMAQGKFSVVRDEHGVEVVSREVAGLKRVRVGARQSPFLRAPRWEEPKQTYAAFAAQIRAFAKELGK